MREGQGKWVIILLLVFISQHIAGQSIEIRGGFIEDSLMIGENVNYWMTASYSPETEVILPDSNFNFAPFEFSSRTIFETQSVGPNAFYSVI
jgi:hypothetical protein